MNLQQSHGVVLETPLLSTRANRHPGSLSFFLSCNNIIYTIQFSHSTMQL